MAERRPNPTALGTLAALMLLAGAVGAQERIDPTRPPASLSAARPSTDQLEEGTVEWNLTATITAGGRREAVINGKQVREGDTIGEATVLTIRPGRVKLRGNEKVFSLTIVTDTIRRPATGIILTL